MVQWDCTLYSKYRSRDKQGYLDIEYINNDGRTATKNTDSGSYNPGSEQNNEEIKISERSTHCTIICLANEILTQTTR